MTAATTPCILVLEDRPTDRLYLTTLLGYRGFTILEAANGEEGLEIVKIRRPDLVLSDVLMPKMDGFEFVRRLRRMPDCATIPVLFYTATYHEAEARQLAEECGVVDILIKPSEPEAILARVDATLAAGTRAAAPLGDEAFGRRHSQLTNEKLLEKVRALEVSERQNALLIDQLRERERTTEFALSAAGIGVYEQLFANDTIRVSKGVRELLDVPEGQPLNDLITAFPPEERERIQGVIRPAIASCGDFTFDVTVTPVNKPQRFLHTRGQVEPGVDGAPQRMLCVLIDMTERRQLELQLRQAQKMEAIGQLAGGVAHDFNNLLTVIQGYARFLQQSARDDDQRHDAEAIAQAGDRAVGLTRQLLAFSRKQARDIETLDLNTLITQVAAMLRRLIGEHITLTTLLGADTGAIENDRGQVEQIVMNLVVNARDAMPAGGEITLETTRVHDVAGQWVQLQVRDNGSGMDADTRSRIFEPFFTTKPPGKGTGIGLATVVSIVSQGGGRITVDSEVGRGTVFTVQLPPAEGAASGTSMPATRRLAGHERILVVEDDDGIRDLLTAMLTRAGYSVSAVANAVEALARPQDSFEVVVTDMLMPGGTGPEMVAAMRTSQPGLRVVYVSGYAPEMTLDAAALNDHTVFLAKPFSSEALMLKIRDVLDR